MKNITKSIIALFAVVALSCNVEDVQDRPVIEGVDSPILTSPASGAAYVLSPANATVQAERFTWKSANFGGNVEVVYTVEIDKKGNAFKTPVELASRKSENQASVSVEILNGAALTLKSTPFAPAEFEVRVKSAVGTNVMFSNIVGIVITPYTTESPKLWVPGGYAQASGYPKDWDPATSPTLAASGYGKVDFEGYINFNDAGAEYKFTSFPEWKGEYAAGATPGTLLASGPNNLKIPAAGYYKMEVDTEKLTYKATKQVWGIVGNGTPGGWDNDTPMTYNKATKTWSIIATLTTQAAPDNGMKFRANNNWDFNFGDTGANGTLEVGGTNISTTAGKYLITLDLSNPRAYTYTMVKQ